MSDENIISLSDENKSAIRNYAMVAGFFTIFVMFILEAINLIADYDAGPVGSMSTVFEIGIIVILFCGIILALLHKRDQVAIVFIFLSFAFAIEVIKTLAIGPGPDTSAMDPAAVESAAMSLAPEGEAPGEPPLDIVMSSISGPISVMLVLFGLMMLITRNEQKYISAAIILPFAVFGVIGTILVNMSVEHGDHIVASGCIISALVAFYAAFVLGADKPKLPGYSKLTVDEVCESNDGSPVHFKVTGAVLGYSIFALPMLAWAMHYLGASGITTDACSSLESYCGMMLVVIGLLMLVAGRMRFTPFLFIMLGMVSSVSGYLGPNGWVSIIFFLAIALILLIRSDKRILVGVAIAIYSVSYLFTDMMTLISVPEVSFFLNFVPFAILTYVAFALCSDERLKLF